MSKACSISYQFMLSDCIVCRTHCDIRVTTNYCASRTHDHIAQSTDNDRHKIVLISSGTAYIYVYIHNNIYVLM